MLSESRITLKDLIEERASDPEMAARTFVIDGDSQWTYSEYRNQCICMAGFLHRRTEPVATSQRGHIAVMMNNCKEYLALLGACSYAGLTFFAINPLLRGARLAETVKKSNATQFLVGEEFLDTANAILSQVSCLNSDALLVLGNDETIPAEQNLSALLAEEAANTDWPDVVAGKPEDPLVVIYTSGTTGVPKGVLVTEARLCLSASIIPTIIPLSNVDVSYSCMPLCHSNALLANFMPMLGVGGTVVLRSRFSVTKFVSDILDFGITYWSYVGEPVHYILSHVDALYNGDETRIRSELTDHPCNRLRFAMGNGASAHDQDLFVKWFGMEYMSESYGQSEAVIMALNVPGTPRGSVGEITDPAVKILTEDGSDCPVAQLDESGSVINYSEAVGQLCREETESWMFPGYYDDPEASKNKCRDGTYYSGDLAHIAIHDGRRYLYFDGRTDDWIRKDGENFSALPIADELSEHPDVKRAVVFGIPNYIGAELVMAVLVLRENSCFDPLAFYAWCSRRLQEGSLGEKWFPDFVRVIDDFEYTISNKIQTNKLKKVHFDPSGVPNSAVYWRQRGEASFRTFDISDYGALREHYSEQERLQLLDR